MKIVLRFRNPVTQTLGFTEPEYHPGAIMEAPSLTAPHGSIGKETSSGTKAPLPAVFNYFV